MRVTAGTAVAVEALVDDDVVGLIYLDSNGDIVGTNTSARELLSQGRGLREERGRLTADGTEQGEALAALIDVSLNGASAGAELESVVVRSSGERPVVVHAMPVVADSEEKLEGRRAAVLVMLDPWARMCVRSHAIAAALGLTKAESVVVALLVRGMTTREIAEATNRMPDSVRWHVKRILAKTGARKQSDLVRMALAAARFPLR